MDQRPSCKTWNSRIFTETMEKLLGKVVLLIARETIARIDRWDCVRKQLLCEGTNYGNGRKQEKETFVSFMSARGLIPRT